MIFKISPKLSKARDLPQTYRQTVPQTRPCNSKASITKSVVCSWDCYWSRAWLVSHGSSKGMGKWRRENPARQCTLKRFRGANSWAIRGASHQITLTIWVIDMQFLCSAVRDVADVVQVDFLNSVIVDQQRRNELLQARLQVMESSTVSLPDSVTDTLVK